MKKYILLFSFLIIYNINSMEQEKKEAKVETKLDSNSQDKIKELAVNKIQKTIRGFLAKKEVSKKIIHDFVASIVSDFLMENILNTTAFEKLIKTPKPLRPFVLNDSIFLVLNNFNINLVLGENFNKDMYSLLKGIPKELILKDFTLSYNNLKKYFKPQEENLPLTRAYTNLFKIVLDLIEKIKNKESNEVNDLYFVLELTTMLTNIKRINNQIKTLEESSYMQSFSEILNQSIDGGIRSVFGIGTVHMPH